MRYFERRHGLKCFSPEVMLATFVIELVLAGYAYAKYRSSEFGRVVFASLILLGVFQFAEYQVCRGILQMGWARLGFVAITLLPVLALHLVALASRYTDLLKAGYILALGSIIVIIFFPGIINGGVCWGNYVVFDTASEMHLPYGVFYFSFLFLGLFKAVQALTHKDTPRSAKPVLAWLIAGYLVFLVPTGIAYAVNEGVRQAVPSVMCGFAVLFALILVWRVLPLYRGAAAENKP